jgi:hypothetical protein
MSDILELWSEPWHALQRTLASSAAGDSKSLGPLVPALAPYTHGPAPAGATWLVRALKLTASSTIFHANS